MYVWKATYTAEGNGPLIIFAGEILSKLEKLIVNGFLTQNIERSIDEALILILVVKTFLRKYQQNRQLNFQVQKKNLRIKRWSLETTINQEWPHGKNNNRFKKRG